MEDVDNEKQLYVVYLGGDPAPGRLSEDHEVVVVVAGDLAEARHAARAKWGGTTKAHVDAVQIVGVVDGYRVSLEPTDAPDSTEVDLSYVS
jgi:hypothetical protein